MLCAIDLLADSCSLMTNLYCNLKYRGNCHVTSSQSKGSFIVCYKQLLYCIDLPQLNATVLHLKLKLI